MAEPLGLNAFRVPGLAGAQTANHANSADPAAATLSNTAAGYTTLGGRYRFVPVAGAVTDYLLFSYQVPAGFRLIVCSMSIASLASVTLGGPAVLNWFLSVGDLASLADASQRRLPLGVQGIPGAAPPAGTVANDLWRPLDPSLVVPSGKFFGIGFTAKVMTVTTGEVYGTCTVNGYHEAQT